MRRDLERLSIRPFRLRQDGVDLEGVLLGGLDRLAIRPLKDLDEVPREPVELARQPGPQRLDLRRREVLRDARRRSIVGGGVLEPLVESVEVPSSWCPPAAA